MCRLEKKIYRSTYQPVTPKTHQEVAGLRHIRLVHQNKTCIFRLSACDLGGIARILEQNNKMCLFKSIICMCQSARSWPKSGQLHTSKTQPNSLTANRWPSDIWQPHLGQIWFTYGKPVPGRHLATTSSPDLVHLRQTGARQASDKHIWPRSGSLTANRCPADIWQPHLAQIWFTYGKPVPADIWQTHLAQIWFTYGKPVPSRHLANTSGPDLVHLWQTVCRKSARTARSQPDSSSVGWLPECVKGWLSSTRHRSLN